MFRFAVLFLIAAPVPPPRPLTTELLTGLWDYRWGGYADGWIALNADGTYYSRHSPGFVPDYAGRWTLRDGTLTLHENRISVADCWSSSCHSIYPIRLTAERYPILAGKCGATAVVLSNPRRN